MFLFTLDSNITALVIAVGSFIFTLYQWLISMNSRRPSLKLVRFQLAQILMNHDYKDFIIYPKTNFILVNLSDLPNAILDMKFYCNISGKWYTGTCDNIQEIFPLFVQGHSSDSIEKGRGTFGVSFPIFPTEAELQNAKFVVELYDQYEKVYKVKLDAKWIQKAGRVNVPYFEKQEEDLGSIEYDGAVQYHLIYNNLPDDQRIGIYDFARYGHGRGGTYFQPEAVKNTVSNSTTDRVFYTDIGRVKLYFAREGGVFNTLEIELEGKTMKKVALPKTFHV